MTTHPNQSDEQAGDTGRRGIRLAPGVVIPEQAADFSYVSSSGPGGQNVNKRATKCVLRVSIEAVPMSPIQRDRLRSNGRLYLTTGDELVISADEHRSQERNREACVERLGELVRRSLAVPKVRRATKPTRGSKERRLREKKQASARKEGRRSQNDH